MSLPAALHHHIASVQTTLQPYLPQSRTSQLLLAASSTTIAALVLFPIAHHIVLGRHITHSYPNASSRQAALECSEFEKISADLLAYPKSYAVYNDKVTKHIPDLTVGLSADLEADFTRLLRHYMVCWNSTPPAWSLFWLGFGFHKPAYRTSCAKEYIEALQFVEGDVVNGGVYEVVKRSPLCVEFAVRDPFKRDAVEGLLVISLRPRNEGATLVAETIQWAKRARGETLPLERWVGRFLHSLAARWLVVQGAQYIRDVVV